MKQKRYRRYKNILEKYLDSNEGKRLFNIMYSVGAAVVILGALFKILHFPYGNLMLMIGMITEAFVFLLSAFEKPNKEYKWEEVYPVLADDENFIPKSERVKINDQKNIQGRESTIQNISRSAKTGAESSANKASKENVSNNIAQSGAYSEQDDARNKARTANIAYTSIPQSKQTDSTSIYDASPNKKDEANVILDASNLNEASEKYAEQLGKMSENMAKFAEVTNSLSKISDTLLNSFQTIIDNSTGIGTNTQGYINQMETLNRNIGGLNTIYEIQLKGVSGQINTIEEINAGLDRMKKLYSGSLADSSVFKSETEKMAKQLSELNLVYARLLQAMTANMNMGNPGFNANNTGGGQP